MLRCCLCTKLHSTQYTRRTIGKHPHIPPYLCSIPAVFPPYFPHICHKSVGDQIFWGIGPPHIGGTSMPRAVLDADVQTSADVCRKRHLFCHKTPPICRRLQPSLPGVTSFRRVVPALGVPTTDRLCVRISESVMQLAFGVLLCHHACSLPFRLETMCLFCLQLVIQHMSDLVFKTDVVLDSVLLVLRRACSRVRSGVGIVWLSERTRSTPLSCECTYQPAASTAARRR